jgi:two-component system cell cycle response regulator
VTGRARVLTIERVLDDARFMDEALAEARETQETSLLLAGLHLEDVEDAIAVLGSEPVDAVLLGVHDGGREALEAFLAVRTAAPHIPVIAVVDASDREFARTLLREGAQDYLVRGQFDYIPLARALENAIERHRVLWASQNASMFDAITGFLNRRGFAVVANYRSRQCDSVIVCELNFGKAGAEARDLALLDFAATIREAVHGDAVVARRGPARFAILAGPADVESIRAAIGNRVTLGCAEVRESLESALGLAEKRLCENRLAYSP